MNGPAGVEEPGAAGTVYLETAAQSGGKGTVTIDNNDLTDTAATMHIPAFTEGVSGELIGATVIVIGCSDDVTLLVSSDSSTASFASVATST